MKKNIYTNCLLLVSFLVFISCGKEKACYTSPLNLAFVKYKMDEVDSIYVLKIKKNSSPVELLDSFLITSNNAYYSSNLDTIFINNYNHTILTSDFDWELRLGANQQTINLEDIITEGRKQKCGGLLSLDCLPCNDPVKSVSVNGQAVVFANENLAQVVIRK
ncbi:hypothetical protein WG954_10190 [Lacibacter sp. H375]|uniref:hypothetical protein n=1 Tax=Lacibacter sp. H375 TaxID=3133424 RepID=UPI0030C2F6F0